LPLLRDALHHRVSSRQFFARCDGAKGIGELPMDGPAPAIVSAVEDALGVPFDSIPLLPEDILEALDKDALAASAQDSRVSSTGVVR